MTMQAGGSISAIVVPFCLILILSYFLPASPNTEVDDLNAFKLNLNDPNGVLETWDPTYANPCRWDHVQCNNNNAVISVKLGNARLTGILAPELGNLANLQTLELYSNNFSGKIPYEWGNLTNLVSLDLYINNLSGPIPYTLGNLKRLRYLRLNNNSLTGEIPTTLTTIPTLQVIDLSFNNLSGIIPFNSSSLFGPISFAGNPHLEMPPEAPPPAIQSPPSSSSSYERSTGTRTISTGVAALTYVAAALVLAWWC